MGLSKTAYNHSLETDLRLVFYLRNIGLIYLGANSMGALRFATQISLLLNLVNYCDKILSIERAAPKRELILYKIKSYLLEIFDEVFTEGCLYIYVKELVSNWVYLVTYGTGPLACLSLFPVAELDKESND